MLTECCSLIRHLETEKGRNGRNGSAERERRQAENRVAGVLDLGDGDVTGRSFAP